MRKRRYSFGPYELDTVEQVLLRDGVSLRLKPKVFNVLAILVENRGRLVCKGDIMKEVWADRFVEESNITVSICKIRKALGESENGDKYIETVPRRGYRFAASVTDTTLPLPSHEESSLVVAGKMDGVPAGRANVTSGSIAVLPFKFIGGPGNEYLGLGMADALITRLSNLKRVTVRPTSSVRKYSGAHDPVSAGRELGVEWVLDGSVQKSRKRLRVTVQLVRIADGVLMWAEKFDENLRDILAVEDSISEQVSKALAPKLTGEEKKALAKRYTESPEAYEAYLRGRYFLDKRTTEGCTKGIKYFEQAITVDPNYALAHTGIAGCYIVLGSYTVAPQQSYLNAEQAILKALSLDDHLAEAHASLGHLRTRQWDWEDAEKELKRAIELNPNYAIGHAWYALFLAEVGKFEAAFDEIRRSQLLDPVSPIIESAAGSLLYLSRRYQQAIERLERALDLDAGFALAHYFLGFAYEAEEHYEEALKEYHQAMNVFGGLPEFAACLARVDALLGRTNEARKAIDELKSSTGNSKGHPSLIALIYTALGDKDQAFLWLERAYAERDPDMCLLKVDPRLDSLRSDPRFLSLLERVGLAQ